MTTLSMNEAISTVFDFIKSTILELAIESGYGPDKKEILDKKTCAFIEDTIKLINFPGPDLPWDIIISKLVEKIVPTLTQKIYDFLKVPVTI